MLEEEFSLKREVGSWEHLEENPKKYYFKGSFSKFTSGRKKLI